EGVALPLCVEACEVDPTPHPARAAADAATKPPFRSSLRPRPALFDICPSPFLDGSSRRYNSKAYRACLAPRLEAERSGLSPPSPHPPLSCAKRLSIRLSP